MEQNDLQKAGENWFQPGNGKPLFKQGELEQGIFNSTKNPRDGISNKRWARLDSNQRSSDYEAPFPFQV